ncbi:MAG TPA: fimbria/pilus outer membrane usher protein [Xanthobacteraceae bacterium]|nr:fimbria/pilus outer membrane usher protein [Xanthobacteraceae bacterium]
MLALVLVLGFTAGRGRADEAGRQMQLEVVLNGVPTQLIGAFVMRDDGHLAARRQELVDIGLNPRGDASPDRIVVLDDLFGLSYRYEESTQRVSITAPEELLITKEYNLRNAPPPPELAKPDYGAVLNYNLFASGASNADTRAVAFSGASATLDGRVFTPYGTLSQSALISSSLDERFAALRLNTTFAYSDLETMTTYRAGDTISSGLAWTRPIRIGGLQVQRNFGLRPDLVTLPLPSARGSAAVPSTADVYINNVKTYSQDVGAGPYLLTNLPAIGGSGTARVVLRDASGHATEANLPFYVSSMLLAPGMFDYSVEAGLPRLSYGTTDDTYVAKPVGSASARYGMYDWLTLAGHVEGGAGLLNASAAVMARTGSFGVASVAAAASRYGGGTGFQSYLSYETKIWGINISASSQMTFGSYDDLASVTARLQPVATDPYDVSSYLDLSTSIKAIATPLYTSARPAKALNRISVGAPLPFNRANLGASFIQTTDATGIRSDIVTATLSVSFDWASVFASAFTTVGGQKNTGFLVGLSMPIGDSVTASTSASGGTSGSSINVEATKTLGATPGSIGWRVRDSEGVGAQRSAAVSYRSDYARTEAGVIQDRNGVQGTAEVEGAIATLGGGVFFANRIDDAFAVVETGVPGIEVFHQNRPAGTTDSSGRMLIPNLQSYQNNKVAIDTTKLPVNADIATTESWVAPADRSGVRLNFAVQTNIRPAIVVLKTPGGEPLAAGAQGQVEGGESFTVGYDGQAYIKNLAATNNVTVTLLDSQCRASFPYEARPDEQVVISPVICQ